MYVCVPEAYRDIKAGVNAEEERERKEVLVGGKEGNDRKTAANSDVRTVPSNTPQSIFENSRGKANSFSPLPGPNHSCQRRHRAEMGARIITLWKLAVPKIQVAR